MPALPPTPIPAGDSVACASLRTVPSVPLVLTKPITSCKLGKPASLRSDPRSASSGIPIGFPAESVIAFSGIPNQAKEGGLPKQCLVWLAVHRSRNLSAGCG
jgi:hypothetical protein